MENLKSNGYTVSKSGVVTNSKGETYTPKEIATQLKKSDPALLDKLQKFQAQKLKGTKARVQKYMATHNKSGQGHSVSSQGSSKDGSSGLAGSGSHFAYDEKEMEGNNLGGGRFWGTNNSEEGEVAYEYGDFVYEEGRSPSFARDGNASLKGLSKVVNGVSIGIQSDDIFDLAHRRYMEQDSQNQFMK